MFSTLRTRFGIPGVISVIALVFALVGGAFAANNVGSSGDSKASDAEATASAKAKRGPRGRKGPKGPVGPAGPQGLAGPQGASGPQGAAGANGSNGTNGADGKTVLNGTAPPAAAAGAIGDFFINTTADTIYGPKTAGGWGLPTALKGAEGSPWTAGGTLPSGETLVGAWSTNTASAAGQTLIGSISFPIPLPGDVGFDNIHYVNPAQAAPAGCTDGTAAAPTADAGHLCVYATVEINAEDYSTAYSGFLGTVIAAGSTSLGINSANPAGAQVYFNSTDAGGYARGSFAVTAP